MWTFFRMEPEGGVLDVRRLNENFEHAAQVATYTGEHNWTESWIGESTLLEEDVAFRHVGVGYAGNPDVLQVDLAITPTWTPVGADVTSGDPTYRVEATTRGGWVWVEASFGFGASLTLSGQTPGLCFGIMVDGNIQYDSVVGGGDLSGDLVRVGAGYTWTRGNTPIPASQGSGPGIRALDASLVISWMGYVPAGTHTFELGYRNPEGADDPATQHIKGNGNLHVMEMRA